MKFPQQRSLRRARPDLGMAGLRGSCVCVCGLNMYARLGADPNESDEHGQTLMHAAAAHPGDDASFVQVGMYAVL